jgi:hypothetical protein
MAKKRQADEDWPPIPGPLPPAPPRNEAAQQLADEAAMLGNLTPLDRAMLAFELEPEHVLGSNVKEGPDSTVEVVIVTQGGQRLRWPADAGRVLAQHEKDGTVPGAAPAGIFKR